MDTFLVVAVYILFGLVTTAGILNTSNALDGLPKWAKVIARILHIALWFPVLVLIVLAIIISVPLTIIFGD